jgi:hypothetical protein
MNIDYKGKILQFPDGMPTEQIEMAIRQMEQSEAPQVAPSETKAEPGFFSAENWTPEGSVGDIYKTFAGGAKDALSGGFVDRLSDVGRVTGQYLGDKIKGRDPGVGMTTLQRSIVDQWGSSARERALREARNPKTALAGSMAGFMGNPLLNQLSRMAVGQRATRGLAEVGPVQRALKNIVVPQSKKATAAKLTALGAGTGGLYGLGKEGTLEAGAEHAALGGALALAGTGVINVGGWGIKKLHDYLLKNAGQRQTAVDMRLLAQALETDGWTIQTASKELERLGPRAVLADLGDATARLTFKAYTKAPKEIRKGFQERQQGVGEPGFKTGGQAQTIDELLGKVSPKSLRETRKELSKTRADDLYDEAEKANLSMMSPEINRILNTTAGRKAWKMARDSMRDRGENLAIPSKELTEIGGEQGIVTGAGIADDGLKLRFLNEVKKHLWDLEQGAKELGPFGKKGTTASGVIGENRKKLTAELDRLDVTARAGPQSLKPEGGAYARARAVEGERLQGMDMLKMGKDFRNKGSVEEMEELLAQATPEQTEAFRTGYVSDLRDVVGKTKGWIDVTKKIQGSETENKKLRLLFDTPEAFKKYMATLAAEGQMYGTGARVMQGSKTAEMTEAVRQGEKDPGRMLQSFLDIKRGITGRDLAAGLRGTTGMARGLWDQSTMTSAQANRLAKSLMGRDLSGLEQIYTPMVQDRNLQNRLARFLMMSGSQPGREYYLGR